MTMKMSDAEYIEKLEAELRYANDLVGAWQKSMSDSHMRAEYYRSLVVAAGQALGPIAYICDDGSVSQEVLCAKVPELVAAIMQRLKEPAGKLTLFEATRKMEGSVLVSPTPVEEKK